MTIQQVKQRFGIIGGSELLDRAIETAIRVASTDLSVLITGESGTGKEVMPQIVHNLSSRKHGSYIAVNCGAIPEGTIDSELFGHEKGAFTGAYDSRKGYFEVANGGTIFLDEVAELPLQTQVRLLRVLETGEFIRVGSSKVIKTDVRVVAATNIDMPNAIKQNKFREDLYYRLNTVPITIPALRERKDDVYLLFRKFASDFAEKYRMPTIQLNDEARDILINHRWPGNIRQLKNITEQISIIEHNRNVTGDVLLKYLPTYQENNLPVLFSNEPQEGQAMNERELLYKVLFDMKKDISDLKKFVISMLEKGGDTNLAGEQLQLIKRFYNDVAPESESQNIVQLHIPKEESTTHDINPHTEIVEESLSLQDREIDLIKKALEKFRGKRKLAAKELGISERTLYRKIKEYDL